MFKNPCERDKVQDQEHVPRALQKQHKKENNFLRLRRGQGPEAYPLYLAAGIREWLSSVSPAFVQREAAPLKSREYVGFANTGNKQGPKSRLPLTV